jgi:hypothetical protein
MSTPNFAAFFEHLPAGRYCAGCLAQLYDAPLVAVRERLLGMPERIELQEALCSNCNERRVTYRHRAA